MASIDIKWNRLYRTLQEFGWDFIKTARKYLSENDTNASGTLSDSMEYEVEINDDMMSVGVWIEDYWYYVENGRKPGKRPPIPKIEEWVLIKPVEPREINGRVPSVKQLSFAIANKIAKEGTEPQPFFRRAVEETKRKYEPLIAEAIQEDLIDYITEAADLSRLFK